MNVGIQRHIRDPSRLHPGSHGRSWMTEEPKEVRVDSGHRRVGPLMRKNRISVERTWKKGHNGQRPYLQLRPEPAGSGRRRRPAEPERAYACANISAREGWLYPAVLRDRHARRVISRILGNPMKRDLATVMGNAGAGRDGTLRIHRRRLHPTPSVSALGGKRPSLSGERRHGCAPRAAPKHDRFVVSGRVR